MSAVTQLSIFVENRAGRTAQVLEVLAKSGVKVGGFMISDTLDYGIIRVVVDKPKAAKKALTDAHFTIKEQPILVVDVHNSASSILNLFTKLAESNINIVYSYSIAPPLIAICVDDVDYAINEIKDTSVTLVDQKSLENLFA